MCNIVRLLQSTQLSSLGPGPGPGPIIYSELKKRTRAYIIIQMHHHHPPPPNFLKIIKPSLLSYVLCPMSHVPCSMSDVPCPMSHVLCPMSYVPCPMSHVPCPMSMFQNIRILLSLPILSYLVGGQTF